MTGRACRLLEPAVRKRIVVKAGRTLPSPAKTPPPGFALCRFGGVRASLPEVVSVPGDVFYGEGYDDSDRRIPDITKARMLLGWEPKWEMREMLEATMRHFIERRAANPSASAAAN